MCLKRARPCGSTYHVVVINRTGVIRVVQAVIVATPIVGQQDHAVHVVNLCLSIADA